LQGVADERVDVLDFRAAFQNLLQALQAAALDAHLLGMGQRHADPRLAQGESKTVSQLRIKLLAREWLAAFWQAIASRSAICT
jgi:hypothetical protein